MTVFTQKRKKAYCKTKVMQHAFLDFLRFSLQRAEEKMHFDLFSFPTIPLSTEANW